LLFFKNLEEFSKLYMKIYPLLCERLL
jgi:hypothetical protein